MAKKVSEERKKDFIDKLASMTDEEIFEYIKKNGKTMLMIGYSFFNGII